MQKKKVLIIDDSKVSRAFIKAELGNAGFEVVECESGTKAAQMFDPSFDLITLDVTMPDLDGFATCQAIRIIEENFPDVTKKQALVPIILISGSESLAERQKGFHAGATDFIAKNAVREHLLNTVEKIVTPIERFASTRILIAEDSKISRKMLEHYLSRMDIQTKCFVDGQQAYEYLEAHPDDFDVILSDINMPVMDGITFCRKVRTDLGMKNIPIIFLTSEEVRTTLVKAFEAGASDYLQKPYLKEELLARLTVHIEVMRQKGRLRESVAELERLNENKNRLLSSCSHDLKAPLSGIKGFTEMLIEDGENLDEQQVKDLHSILKCIDVQCSLIDEISAVTRWEFAQDNLEMHRIDLLDVALECIEILQSTSDLKNIKMTCNSENAGNTMIMANTQAITRLINNLVSNAIKFTPKNGTIDVSISQSEGNFIQLEVKDSGIGIPQEMQDHLFEAYSKASRSGTEGEGSTGLGLSICKKIVENHGGSIHVHSEEGRGTAFEVFFPKEEAIKESA